MIESLFIMIRPPPKYSLFPYTTLFRSQRLPGLRVDDNKVNSRIFVDDDLVDASRAGDIFWWIKHREVNRVPEDRKSTRLNSSHRCISYAVFGLKKKTADAAGRTDKGVE